jgi:signal transduction histidine kinase
MAGGITVTRRREDMNLVCARVVTEHRASMPGRAIRLHEAANVTGNWDADRIEQAVGNLVSNALKFSPEHSVVDVTIEDAGDEVVVRVRNDNFGEGIPPEDLPHVFDPFRWSTPPLGGAPSTGLGLGLFIVKEIAAAHGGDIQVESFPGDGTTFKLSLPRSLEIDRDHRMGAPA